MVAADLSDVVLAQIERVASGLDLHVETWKLDIEQSGLGSRRFDVIVKSCFLDRRLLARLHHHLKSGGLALFSQPTEINLSRNHSPSIRFCLRDGEIFNIAEQAARTGLEIIEASQKWRDSGVHEGWLAVQRQNR